MGTAGSKIKLMSWATAQLERETDSNASTRTVDDQRKSFILKRHLVSRLLSILSVTLSRMPNISPSVQRTQTSLICPAFWRRVVPAKCRLCRASRYVSRRRKPDGHSHGRADASRRLASPCRLVVSSSRRCDSLCLGESIRGRPCRLADGLPDADFDTVRRSRPDGASLLQH